MTSVGWKTVGEIFINLAITSQYSNACKWKYRFFLTKIQSLIHVFINANNISITYNKDEINEVYFFGNVFNWLLQAIIEFWFYINAIFILYHFLHHSNDKQLRP